MNGEFLLTYEQLQLLATAGWLITMGIAGVMAFLPIRCSHRPGCPDCAREAREKKNGGAASRPEFCPLCRKSHTPDEPHGPTPD